MHRFGKASVTRSLASGLRHSIQLGVYVMWAILVYVLAIVVLLPQFIGLVRDVGVKRLLQEHPFRRK